MEGNYYFRKTQCEGFSVRICLTAAFCRTPTINFLYMCVGEKIVLTNNLWTQKGLVNGANGIIGDIIFLISSRNNLPQTILIEFEHFTGPNFFLDFHPKNSGLP